VSDDVFGVATRNRGCLALFSAAYSSYANLGMRRLF